jgi:dihydroorotate dehydrogenase (NAD+) catalytic subunit
MSMIDLTSNLGPIELTTPLIAASGTVGSAIDFVEVVDFSLYGAAVAKSVSETPWAGRPAPRIAPAGVGMLNGIGIQNPGIASWLEEVAPRARTVPTRVWGSAVGRTAEEFGRVAQRMEKGGIEAIEVNLSCPNLDGHLFALDPERSASVVREVRQSVDVPIGAKLSPNAAAIVDVAAAVAESGADWVVLTNTALGASIDLETRRPVLSGTIGGYSGPPLKPLSMRCVIEVHRVFPDLPIVGLGGVASGDDVVEYTLAGASAVGVGTAHFAQPRVARRILREIERRLKRMGVGRLRDLVGGMREW